MKVDREVGARPSFIVLTAWSTLFSTACCFRPTTAVDAAAPVIDKDANLIPLPHDANPDAVLEVQLKLAQTNDARRVTVAAPIVAAPVMLAEWKLEPDTGRRLIYESGTLTPVGAGRPAGVCFFHAGGAFNRH